MSDLGNVVFILFAFLNNFENFESELPFYGVIDGVGLRKVFFYRLSHLASMTRQSSEI